MLSEAFAGVLRSGREHFNREFKSAQRKYPELDGGSFGAFLASAGDPLVQATAARRPESAGAVALAAYDVALELVGQRLAGPRARHDLLDLGWRQVLPPVAELVAHAPFQILSALSNALHQLAA